MFQHGYVTDCVIFWEILRIFFLNIFRVKTDITDRWTQAVTSHLLFCQSAGIDIFRFFWIAISFWSNWLRNKFYFYFRKSDKLDDVDFRLKLTFLTRRFLKRIDPWVALGHKGHQYVQAAFVRVNPAYLGRKVLKTLYLWILKLTGL